MGPSVPRRAGQMAARLRDAVAARPATVPPRPAGAPFPPNVTAWNIAAYRRHVAALLAAHDLDTAVRLAVGGFWDETGPLLVGALELAGLGASSVVVDVGCGAGRLAAHLPEDFAGAYHGTDVVEELVAYARAHVVRDRFTFSCEERLAIPLGDRSADVVCFFSVFTHLPHEAIYAYLAEARRVLVPGGAVVASFLEFADPALWPVFEEMTRDLSAPRHHNQFLHREDLAVFCGRLGLAIERLISAEEAVIPIRPDPDQAPEHRHFGQALAILRVP